MRPAKLGRRCGELKSRWAESPASSIGYAQGSIGYAQGRRPKLSFKRSKNAKNRRVQKDVAPGSKGYGTRAAFPTSSQGLGVLCPPLNSPAPLPHHHHHSSVAIMSQAILAATCFNLSLPWCVGGPDLYGCRH